MAALLTFTLSFSPNHIRHPPSFLSPSTLASHTSCHLHLDANNHNPEHKHLKGRFKNVTSEDSEFCAKPKSLSASTPNKSIISLGAWSAIFLTLSFTGDCYATGIESQLETINALIAQEPKNALSLPTWAIHVSSVVEWVVAMALVWQYGDKPGYRAWKGLSWGMVPLLGGALCACTWHFFYNAESLEILVAIQGALTVIGNFTMLVAAFRIYESTKGGSEIS